MNAIGFRYTGFVPVEDAVEDLSACVAPDNVTVEICRENIARRILAGHVKQKAIALALEYIGYHNAYGDSHLEKLIELKRSYRAML